MQLWIASIVQLRIVSISFSISFSPTQFGFHHIGIACDHIEQTREWLSRIFAFIGQYCGVDSEQDAHLQRN